MSTPDMIAAEARQLGVLQEVNRRLLHPRGLALYVDGSGAFGLADYRPEGGIEFCESVISTPEARDRAAAFDALALRPVQPIDPHEAGA